MAFYLEYPHRKLPHGISPTHPSKPPDLSSAIVNLTVNVATSAQETCNSETLTTPCHSSVLLFDEEIPPLPSKELNKKKKKADNIAETDVLLGKKPPLSGILYPSRAVSPRPKNHTKNVNWPDMRPPEDDSTQKQEDTKACLSVAAEDAVESFFSFLCCDRELEAEDVSPPPPPPPPHAPPVDLPPLATYFEPRECFKKLTVKTDFDDDDEAVPLNLDPILSFREHKLKKKKCDHSEHGELNSESFIFSDDDSGSDDSSEDDIRDDRSTDGEDWAPLSRQPPPPPSPMPLQIQLRNEASRRYDEIQERLRHNKGQETMTPRTENVVNEAILEGIPKDMNSLQTDKSSPMNSEKSGTTWTLDEKPEKRIPPLINVRGWRRKKCKEPSKHFAEIQWKHAPQPSPEAIHHVGEIPWKTHEGRHVAKLKEKLKREPSYNFTEEDKKWAAEIKEVVKSSASIGEVMSLDSEDIGNDKYNHSSPSHCMGGAGIHAGGNAGKSKAQLIQL